MRRSLTSLKYIKLRLITYLIYKLLLITAVLFSNLAFSNNVESLFFSLLEPKVSGKLNIQDPEDTYPLTCHDGSELIEFSSGNYEETPLFVQVCKYGEDPELLIVHTWENGLKKAEIISIDGNKAGLSKIRSKLGYLITEICQYNDIRSEYYDHQGELFSIFLLDPLDKEDANTIIDIKNIGRSVFGDKYSDFEECDWNNTNFKNETFNKQLYWSWNPLPPKPLDN